MLQRLVVVVVEGSPADKYSLYSPSFPSQAGITLFTVSHRKSLWKYHEFFLYMDGKGNYTYKRIGEDTIEFGS